MGSKFASFPVSDHCNGRRFFNPRGQIDRTWFDVLRWKFGTKPIPWPARVVMTPRRPVAPPVGDSLAVTWINHATFLIQTSAGALITDPIYSKIAGPFGRIGPRRVHLPGVRFDDLPPISTILLSHDHYDHCDLPTLRRLAARNASAIAITPLGNGGLFRRAGFASHRIVELDWWGMHEPTPGLHLQLTPARHWSNRLSGRRNVRLWGGFFVRGAQRRFLFVGDSGYDDRLFVEIRNRCGAPDLAMIPIGGYEPRWFMESQHCNPKEAVRIHRDLGAGTSLAMHWGTFPLTDEGREEPAKELVREKQEAHLPEDAFRILQPGETIVV